MVNFDLIFSKTVNHGMKVSEIVLIVKAAVSNHTGYYMYVAMS